MDNMFWINTKILLTWGFDSERFLIPMELSLCDLIFGYRVLCIRVTGHKNVGMFRADILQHTVDSFENFCGYYVWYTLGGSWISAFHIFRNALVNIHRLMTSCQFVQHWIQLILHTFYPSMFFDYSSKHRNQPPLEKNKWSVKAGKL